jgi:hypothetical protein
MGKSGLRAFSDGVIAIMVLDSKSRTARISARYCRYGRCS